jgi:acetyl-CoA carboxylase carboxyltransferase component
MDDPADTAAMQQRCWQPTFQSAPVRSMVAVTRAKGIGGIVMARKKRKSVAVKRKKKSKTTAKKRKLRSRRRRGLRQKVSSAYRTVVDTIKGTDQLRNKMEPTGTTETE